MGKIKIHRHQATKLWNNIQFQTEQSIVYCMRNSPEETDHHRETSGTPSKLWPSGM
jgi:hypothetical protein